MHSRVGRKALEIGVMRVRLLVSDIEALLQGVDLAAGR